MKLPPAVGRQLVEVLRMVIHRASKRQRPAACGKSSGRPPGRPKDVENLVVEFMIAFFKGLLLQPWTEGHRADQPPLATLAGPLTLTSVPL